MTMLDNKSTAEERAALLTKLPVEAPPEQESGEENTAETEVPTTGAGDMPADQEQSKEAIGGEENEESNELGISLSGSSSTTMATEKKRHKKNNTSISGGEAAATEIELTPEELADLDRLKVIVRDMRKVIKQRRILIKPVSDRWTDSTRSWIDTVMLTFTLFL